MENIQTTDKNAKEIVDFAKQNLIEKLKASGWADFLKTFLHSSNFDDIIYKLWDAKNQGQRFTPQLKDVFRAFEVCPINSVKVIIVGQDPYPTLGVADGIAFSCSKTEKVQPSLQYIFDAIKKTVYNGADVELDKNLINWSNQGVLLLNSAFTCQIGKPGTHYEIWKEFMAFAIDMMSYGLDKTIWVFMGKKSQELSELVDEDKHIIINTSHPASAVYTGKKEWDCNDVFNKVNEALLEMNVSPIKW
jgi:uracil-DNA glycosylase